MQALNQNQRNFVVAFIMQGGQNATAAALAAGYANTEGSARVAAHRLVHHPRVQLALREEADKRLRAGALLGASVVQEIASDALHKDRLKAAIELLNRSGLLVEQTHRVIHEDNRSDSELERAVLAMATKYGMDPVKLLGDATKKVAAAAAAVDAEFVEVELTGAEGLEDLLG